MGTTYRAFQILNGPGTLFCSVLDSFANFTALAPRVCDDAYQAVCAGASTTDPAGEERIAIFQEGRDSAGARFGFAPTMAGLHAFVDANPTREQAVYQHLRLARRESVHRRLAHLGAGSVPNAAGEVIRAMIAAIEAPDGSFTGGPLPDDRKRGMIEALARLHVPDPLEFLEGGPADPAIRALMASRCGEEGMNVNAFKPPGHDLIILCPGYLLAAGMSAPDSRERLLDRIAHTVAHEAGHAIDTDAFPMTNEGNAYCLGRLLDRREPGHRRNQAKDVDELIADHWAAQTMAELMRRKPTREDAARLLVDGTRIDCRFDRPSGQGSGDVEAGHDHPPTRFRLRTVLGGNPGIRRALGCEEPEGWPRDCAALE